MKKEDRHAELMEGLAEIRDAVLAVGGVKTVVIPKPKLTFPDITEEPPVGSQVTDRDGDVWERREGGWSGTDEYGLGFAYCKVEWSRLRNYAPLRPTTDADRERVGLPVESAPADVDPDEDRAAHKSALAAENLRRAEKLEADLARVTKERDGWKDRHAALRADVDGFQYRHRGYPSTWELVDALARDTERRAS